jgi:ubiquinol-cytochrome c reductase cytochrome c1 subunit
MKRLILALAGLGFSAAALANEGAALPLEFKVDSGNIPSVQRGARDFMSYCSGCHSMKHLRYSRISQDLGIPADLMKKNLMFTSDKIGDHIQSSMPAEESAKWFGQTPPDLTLETRIRGADWVFNYLNTFYVDESRPLGVNNLVLPGVSMPHVLADLQGLQVKPAAAKEEASGEHAEHEGHEGHEGGTGLQLVHPGKLSPEQYEKFTTDLVNFMDYAAEPGRAERLSMAPKVLLYLLVLTILCYLLKKEYWKDVQH